LEFEDNRRQDQERLHDLLKKLRGLITKDDVKEVFNRRSTRIRSVIERKRCVDANFDNYVNTNDSASKVTMEDVNNINKTDSKSVMKSFIEKAFLLMKI
jgi:hypothetical protein